MVYSFLLLESQRNVGIHRDTYNNYCENTKSIQNRPSNAGEMCCYMGGSFFRQCLQKYCQQNTLLNILIKTD
ncbi:hypothetical protein V1478_009707 [Vespula squamosa]|uniref:Uncharacterized protein n=1 Tax=Vespula squamosa TaxID=30214 RepID=A0ABD2AQF6_VESSQ